MAGEKILIGPKLRELRQSRSLTQAKMAGELGVSASYINLIERNQRPASLKFLITLSDAYGLNWRELTRDSQGLALSDLRQITKDTVFGSKLPDIEELRSALDNSPNLVNGFVNIYNAYRAYGERLAEVNEFLSANEDTTLGTDHSVHDFFRTNNNYFAELELAAEKISSPLEPGSGDLFALLRSYLETELGVEVVLVRDEVLGSSLRYFNRKKKELVLSDGLDHINRIFQMAHMSAFIGHDDLLNELLPETIGGNELASSRCRVELANYFAAAVMMPYNSFHAEALNFRYDIERLAARFSVSYEHVCHRLTTLQRPGRRGIPFFFLRIDRGGNVSKRFNVTPHSTCPFWRRMPETRCPLFVSGARPYPDADSRNAGS